MNYFKHYDRLISRARNRLIETYTERHHIIPKCMDGSDEPDNLVSLTAEEHYIAHLLLVKMYPGNHKLVFAASMMTRNNPKHKRSNNKMYGWLRRKYAQACSKGKRKERKKETKPRKPKVYTDEWKQKLAEARRGRTMSPESIAKRQASFRRTIELRKQKAHVQQ